MPQFVEYLAFNAVLVAILGFFVKIWINGIKTSLDKMENRLNTKVDIVTCDRIHRIVDRLAHTHGSSGSAGEMIETK